MVQSAGGSGGVSVSRLPMTPFAMSCSRCGNCPASSSGWISRQSAPAQPSNSSLGVFSRVKCGRRHIPSHVRQMQLAASPECLGVVALDRSRLSAVVAGCLGFATARGSRRHLPIILAPPVASRARSPGYSRWFAQADSCCDFLASCLVGSQPTACFGQLFFDVSARTAPQRGN